METFKTKKGDLTLYSFACGYIQRKEVHFTKGGYAIVELECVNIGMLYFIVRVLLPYNGTYHKVNEEFEFEGVGALKEARKVFHSKVSKVRELNKQKGK